MLWRPIDALAQWVLRMSTRTQMRLGILLTLFSLMFYPYMFIGDEPPVVLFLSVLATTLTGITIVFAAQPDSTKDESCAEE
jgi:hypothetical protein